MIDKNFSYSRRGIPLGGKEGREKGKGSWLRVWSGEKGGENGIRLVENGVRKRYEGVEGVKGK